jgi:hypothetical protein
MDSGGVPPGSDIAIGFKNSAVVGCENGCISDYSTVRHSLPLRDSTQNVELLSFNEGEHFMLLLDDHSLNNT